MKSTVHPSSLIAKLSLTVPGIATVVVLSVALSVAQSRIIRPPSQTNSGGPAKRPHVTTLRASDSANGSRVAVSSDQSLTNYEAYRRGDRFYVRIPAADVPRAEATRGRGFADVKAQRTGDSTVVSFRLQPGATAHVEQRANRLEVVFTVPGGTAGTGVAPSRDTARPKTNTNSTASSKPNTNNRAANSSTGLPAATSAANRNSSLLTARGPVPPADNPAAKPTPALASAAGAGQKAGASPTPTPKPAGATRTATPTPKAAAISSPSNQSISPAQPPSRGTFWSQAKQKVNYWILLAQLNPVPVAIGAGVLLLLIGLLILQRRRARGARRTRRRGADSAKTKTVAASSKQPAVSTADATAKTPVPVEAAAAGIATAAVVSKEPIEEPKPVKTEVPPPTAAGDAARRERVARVSDEVKNVMAGGEYNESVIGSDDRETRKLVGAELLAALVGRSIPRRERARAAFMKHGYFDDATRDLRIAESANERAAAARRLSFVREREATPHLIGALDDPAPDVRRAAVEALMDLRDPTAIGPLNSLLQTENDRKVPRTLIKHAIDACATTTSAEEAAPAVSTIPSAPVVQPTSLPTDSEREVLEI